MNVFYKFLIENIATELNMKLSKCINTLEQYNYFNDKEKLSAVSKERCFLEQELYVKKIKDNKTVYDLFFFNFHIHISLSDNEQIYSIRLKKTEDSWTFYSPKEEVDFSHPTNQTYEVFVWYNVPVLDFTKCVGYNYKNGSWDKYFYQTLKKFFKDIENVTDNNKFNEYYK